MKTITLQSKPLIFILVLHLTTLFITLTFCMKISDSFRGSQLQFCIWREVESDHQDLVPAARRICSYESQKVRDQGAIRSQHGRKPLYRAATRTR